MSLLLYRRAGLWPSHNTCKSKNAMEFHLLFWIACELPSWQGSGLPNCASWHLLEECKRPAVKQLGGTRKSFETCDLRLRCSPQQSSAIRLGVFTIERTVVTRAFPQCCKLMHILQRIMEFHPANSVTCPASSAYICCKNTYMVSV